MVAKYANNNFQIERDSVQVLDVADVPTGPAINYISFASSATGSALKGLAYYRNKGVFFNDGTQDITATNLSADYEGISSSNYATLGSDDDDDEGFVGDISELIIYNNSLTIVELNEILNYLSSKYRITLERE